MFLFFFAVFVPFVFVGSVVNEEKENHANHAWATSHGPSMRNHWRLSVPAFFFYPRSHSLSFPTPHHFVFSPVLYPWSMTLQR